jgi:hypothetical protein
MTPLSLTLYVLLTTLALLSAQFSAVNSYKEAVGAIAVVQLRDVLNGFAVYTVNHWNDLTLSTPNAIAYTDPLTQASVNVVDVKSPSANELMLLGFLSSPSSTSSNYTAPILGGSFKTIMSITPLACTGNACNIDLYVYCTTPVAKTNGQFDSHLISTSINTTSTTVGYTYPALPSKVVGSNNAWSYQMADGAVSGMAMVHTSMGTDVFNVNYPCIGNGCWKSPVQNLTQLPLLKNSLGDIRLVTSLGVGYSWTGAFWNSLNTNSLASAFIGQNSGNTGSNNVYIGTNSGKNFYVED